MRLVDNVEDGFSNGGVEPIDRLQQSIIHHSSRSFTVVEQLEAQLAQSKAQF
jgi:hypothetical protein